MKAIFELKPFPGSIIADCRNLAVVITYKANGRISSKNSIIHHAVSNVKSVCELEEVVFEGGRGAAAGNSGTFNLPMRLSVGDGSASFIVEVKSCRIDARNDAFIKRNRDASRRTGHHSFSGFDGAGFLGLI